MSNILILVSIYYTNLAKGYYMSRINTEKNALFTAFKEILKSRKVSYKVLADKTNLAESTIKRIFSKEECSISKIIQLAGVLDLTLFDLTSFAKEKTVNTSMFSYEAEKFLSKNLEYFYFYRRLFIHKNLKEILKDKKNKKKLIYSYLRKLDDLEIIEWKSGDKILFKHKGFLKFQKGGPLQTAFYKSWLPKFNKRVLDKMSDDKHEVKAFSASVSKEAKNNFFDKYDEIVKDLLKVSTFEVKTIPREVEPFSVAFTSGPYRMGDIDSLEVI